jgi:hypothetical protein
MADPQARVLLIMSQTAVDRARALAGKSTAALKLPVSLQVVLRALIEEGLTREDHPRLLANIESHAEAVRERRRTARTAVGPLRVRRADPRAGRRRRSS